MHFNECSRHGGYIYSFKWMNKWMNTFWLSLFKLSSTFPTSLRNLNILLFLLPGSFTDFHYSQDSSQLFHMVPEAETYSFKKLKAYIRDGSLGVILDYFLSSLVPLSLKISTLGLRMCVFVVFLCMTICVCMSMCCVYVNSCSFCSWCYKMSLRLLLFGKDCTRKVLDGSLGNVT